MIGRSLVAVAVAALLAAGCAEDLGGTPLATDADLLQTSSAQAMGDVTSVRFTVERTGAPVYIDAARSLSLDRIEGRFAAPRSADAIVTVTVNDSLGTKLGAVAIDDEVWMSNPITGEFETLPAGFDIDPSLFFDPTEGWRPLIAGLEDLEFIAEENRGGTRYHLRGLAPAERMETITAGLVRGRDVELDLWMHPVTTLITAVEFTTEFEGEASDWELDLDDYGEEFEISDPTLP